MNYNPADHYVHVLAVTPGREEECRATVNRICDEFNESPEGRAVLEEVEYEKTHKRELPGFHFPEKKQLKIVFFIFEFPVIRPVDERRQ